MQDIRADADEVVAPFFKDRRRAAHDRPYFVDQRGVHADQMISKGQSRSFRGWAQWPVPYRGDHLEQAHGGCNQLEVDSVDGVEHVVDVIHFGHHLFLGLMADVI